MASSQVVHLLLAAGLVLLRLVVAQAPADVFDDFCRRYGHQTAIIDRKLYIDGGWLYANPISRNPEPVINGGLLYSDLDVAEDGMPKQHANLTKNDTVPDVAGGILWQDEINKVFWLFGGEFSSAPSSFQLWGYDVILNQWNRSDAPDDSNSQIQRVSYGAGVSISESGRAFYYGGYLNNKTNPLWGGPQVATSNLIIYDMDENRLTNNTGYDSTGRAEGTMVYIPASGAGMLIYFGGATFPYGNETAEAAPLDTILIYDIGDAKWFTQTATGDIPASRRKSCGGATWADDQSSYQVYIYGGFGFGENATGFDDVYILSMPSFEWIKWYPEKPGPSGPHGWLTCNVVEMSQMIVMGGNFTNSTECDVPIVQAQHNLNLGKYNADNAKWYQYLPNVTDYFVPQEVLQVTGGTSRGGATQKEPSNGQWDDDRVATYFGQKAAYIERKPTRVIPTATAIPTPKPGKKTNVGAIAGGVVGGVAALVLAILALFFFRRRRRNQKVPPQATPSGSTAPERFSPLPPLSANTHDSKFAVLGPESPPMVGGTSPHHLNRSPVQPYPSPPYTTPPPMGSLQPMYHPAHSPPLASRDYFPPPEPSRSNSEHVIMSEMPTVRSPQANHPQPWPVRGELG